MTSRAHEWKQQFRSSLLTVQAISFLILTGSCEEQLPEYRDPRNAMEGKVQARYVFGLTDNSMKIEFRVVNKFDETFEGKAVLQGTGSVLLKRKPWLGRSFSLTSVNVTNGKYNPASGILRMDPNDTLRVVFSWNFISDSGVDLRQTEFQYYSDVTCNWDQPIVVRRNIAFQETFIIRLSLKVFEKIPDLGDGPYEFTMCHVDQWVMPNYCAPIIFDSNFCPANTP